MKVSLSYGYEPFTTAVYFEKAFETKCKVQYVGPPYRERKGYLANEDVYELSKAQGGIDLFFFVEPPLNFFPKCIEKLNCPTVCYLVDVHCDLWPRELYAPFFDYIFVAQKDYVEHFKEQGYKNTFWLPLACDSEIHKHKALSRIYDIGFVGKLFPKEHRRNLLLKKLSEMYKMNDSNHFYPKEEISNIYSQSKIVVNIPYNDDLNMRVFEAMASGSLLITESIGNGQKDLFKDGVHLVEYRSEEELFEKIDYYLRHDEERERIAKTGQELVLSRHTYNHRVDFILETIFKDSHPKLDAKVRKMPEKEVRLAYAKVYSMLRLVNPVIEEIREAYNSNNLTIKLWIELVKSILRAINIAIPLTISARKFKKRNNR